jgi:hypothetical protein
LLQVVPVGQTLPHAPQLLFVVSSMQLLPLQHRVSLKMPEQQKNCPGPLRHAWPTLVHDWQVCTQVLSSPGVAASTRHRALQAERLGLATAPPLPKSVSTAPPAKPAKHFNVSRRVKAPPRALAN